MKFQTAYHYTRGHELPRPEERAAQHALELGRERLNPTLRDPNYLILRARMRLISRWLERVPGPLRVLDVGGRIQPYRALVEKRLASYVAVDPQPAGLHNVIALGEHLPFPAEAFDLVVCTQVLTYVADPRRVVDEMHRVLKVDGVLLLSAPAFFPWHHDERWRFLPDGLRVLLNRFREVEVAPEGYSIAGVCRTVNLILDLSARSRLARLLIADPLIRLFNCVGVCLDGFSRGNEQFTVNNSVFARK